MPKPELSPQDQKAVLDRFRENLYPTGHRKGEKYPGAAIDRLYKAGCPGWLVTQFLFAYALGADTPRKQMRERGRVTRMLLHRTIQDAPVKARYYRLHGQAALAEEAERETQRAEWRIAGIRKIGLYSERRLGVAPLEYLVEWQECAKHFRCPLTDRELSGLVWAAVSALHPKAKGIETESLVRSLARFRKRNPGLIQSAEKLIPAWLDSHRIATS